MRSLLSLLLVVVALPARGATLQAVVKAPADSEFEAVLLKDGQTIGLWLQGLDPKAVKAGLARILAEPLDVPLELPSGPGRPKSAIAYARAEAPVERVQADWKAGAWTLKIITNSRLDALDAHIAAEPAMMPRGVDTALLVRGERALKQHHIPLAKHYFHEATKVYALRAWAELRRADLFYAGGEASSACRLWRRTQSTFPERVPGIVAGLRAHVAGCDGAAMPNWRGLLTHHHHRDDLVGQRLRTEARWALGVEDRVEIVLAALKVGRDDLGGTLQDALFSRAIRRADAFRVAETFESENAPRSAHPEALDLHFMAARAFCTLDLQGLAQKTLAHLPRANWVHLSPFERQSMTARLASCSADVLLPSAEVQAGREKNKLAAADVALVNRVSELERRVKTAQLVLRATGQAQGAPSAKEGT